MSIEETIKILTAEADVCEELASHTADNGVKQMLEKKTSAFREAIALLKTHQRCKRKKGKKIDLKNKCGSCKHYSQIGETACGMCLKQKYGADVVSNRLYVTVQRCQAKCKRYEERISITYGEAVKIGTTTEAESPWPDGDTSILACPRCGSGEWLHNPDENRNKFCGQCGQAIDWGLENG